MTKIGDNKARPWCGRYTFSLVHHLAPYAPFTPLTLSKVLPSQRRSLSLLVCNGSCREWSVIFRRNNELSDIYIAELGQAVRDGILINTPALAPQPYVLADVHEFDRSIHGV